MTVDEAARSIVRQVVRRAVKRLMIEVLAIDETLPPVSSTCTADLRTVTQRLRTRVVLQTFEEEEQREKEKRQRRKK
jgi:hypothetical protein